jgi:hypothetical protein
MAEDNSNIDWRIIGQNMERLLTDVAEVKQLATQNAQRLENMAGILDRVDRNVDDLNLAVANLTLSNRHLRADTTQILAESGEHEKRIARIEKHLGLTDA